MTTISCFVNLHHYYSVTNKYKEFDVQDHYTMKYYLERTITYVHKPRVVLHNHQYNLNLVTATIQVHRPAGPRLDQLMPYTLEIVRVTNVNKYPGRYLMARQIALLRVWMKFLSKDERI